MNDTPRVCPAGPSLRHYDLATLRSLIATWTRRERIRRDLARLAKASPHLIDDIGLTRRQVETEIAKHFWQV